MMTTISETVRDGAASDRRSLAARLDSTFLFLILASLWFLMRPYEGIVGDAFLYVGRAVADLDPQGVGRDWLFETENQMRFSAYPVLLRWLVAHFGPAAAAKFISIFALSLWFSALVFFATALGVRRPATWLMIFFVTCARGQYSPFTIYFGEALAAPRPLAESFVLLALASLLRGRDLVALLLLGVAASLHPILALAGVGVFAVVKIWEQPRWLILAVAATGALAAAMALKLPLAERLGQSMDPQWRALLNPGLFVSHWRLDLLGAIATCLATVALAAFYLDGRARKIFVAAVLVCVGGFAASLLFGDLLSNLLVIQAQVWRADWLVVMLAPASAALLLVEAARRPASAWLAPALLAMAWAPFPGGVKIMCSALALLCFAMIDRGGLKPRDGLSAIGACMLLIVAGLVALLGLKGGVALLLSAPDSLFAMRATLFALGLHGWPLCAAIAALALSRPRIGGGLTAGAALVAVVLAVFLWDARSDYRRRVDEGQPIAAFSSVMSGKGGEVYWGYGANEAWQLLGRPSWLSYIQSYPIVFSRPLAMMWDERRERVLAQDLEHDWRLNHVNHLIEGPQPLLSATKLKDFCASVDAPAWIVWPLYDGQSPPADVSPRAIWPTPRDLAIYRLENGEDHPWMVRTGLMLMDCHQSG